MTLFPRRRLVRLLLILVVPFLVGTLGYMLIEGWTMTDAFYMTAIGLTTVGFGEVQPLSNLGQIFTVFLIVFGLGSVAYGLGLLGEFVLTANVTELVQRRRITRMVDKMKDHVIVCGYGRVGKSAAAALSDGGRDIVIVEKNEDVVQELVENGYVVVEGDAAKDTILETAGIERAWALIVCTGDDSLNLFIVLSSRALNPDLFIITRSIAAENEPKMRLAGANRVVSPYHIGGRHMANIAIRPHVTDFFDVVTLDGGVELWVEELMIEAGSPLAGASLGEADVRRRTGVTLVALNRQSRGSTIMPDANTILEAGDQVIVLGTRDQLLALEKLTIGQ